jgi:pimeloyl-ACP methyl ester carboxylesterase
VGIRRLDVPTLFIWGEDDPFSPPAAPKHNWSYRERLDWKPFRAATSPGSMTPTSAHPRSLRF